MELQIINKKRKKDLDFISAICLDPSVDKKTRILMENAMADRIRWIERMIPKGLEILVASERPRDEKIHYKWVGKMLHSDLAIQGKVPMGLLEYVPIEHALEPIYGKNSLFINCMWVLPPFWKMGVGKALLESFIQKSKEFGGASVISYDGDKWFGTSINYMPSSFFRKYDFQDIEKKGTQILQYLDLGSSEPPRFISSKIEDFGLSNDTNINIFFNYQCPWARYMINTIKKGLKKYNKINLKYINTDKLDVLKKSGISRGICLNNKMLFNRMASWEEIKPIIDKMIKEQQ